MPLQRNVDEDEAKDVHGEEYPSEDFDVAFYSNELQSTVRIFGLGF